MITPRKALYEFGSGQTPLGSTIETCTALRCDSVILKLDTISDAKVAAARAAGIRVWVYAGPHAWEPSAWRGTVIGMRAAVRQYGLMGYIADAETGPETTDPPCGRGCAWNLEPESEAAALAAALELDARAGLSVGFTSFPYWKHRAVIASRAPSVWGSPQLYGVHSDYPPIATIKGWGDPWKTLFPGPRYVPSLAGWGWGLPGTPLTFPQYLAGMSGEPAGIFWRVPGQAEPSRPNTRADLEALAAWQPGSRPGGGGALGWLLGLGLVYGAYRVLR